MTIHPNTDHLDTDPAAPRFARGACPQTRPPVRPAGAGDRPPARRDRACRGECGGRTPAAEERRRGAFDGRRGAGARRAHLVLAPASALPIRADWRAIADRLRPGDVLFVVPAEGKRVTRGRRRGA